MKYNVVCWLTVNGRKEVAYKKKGLNLMAALLFLARNIRYYPLIWVEKNVR